MVNDDYIHGGSQALPILQAKVQKALNAGEQVHITITNDFMNQMVGAAHA